MTLDSSATSPLSFSTLTLTFPPLILDDSRRRMSVAANYYSTTKYARRLLLMSGFVPILFEVNPVLTASLPGMEEPDIIPAPRTMKLPGGIRIQDIVIGDGQTAEEGDVVVFNYVCRRSNGYFVYSTVDQFTGEATPVTLPLDEKQKATVFHTEIIKGLKDVIVGMKIGGKRRALIPPSLGYVNENLKPIPDEFGPRRSLLSHASEPLVFEVQLLKIL